MLNELKSLQDRAGLRRSQAASARRLAPELPPDEGIRILAGNPDKAYRYLDRAIFRLCMLYEDWDKPERYREWAVFL